MENFFWPLQENIVTEEDKGELINFINTTNRFTQFEKVKQFEEVYSKWQGCKYSVYVNSGSSANLILINALKEKYNWKDGDEIIVPAITWITNISPVIQCGLKPVFVDVNFKDFSFDYENLGKEINEKTRAIFITHLIGFPADVKKIKEIIGNRDIKIMEDCCESHGATIEGIKIGNHGVASTFSFYWGHHMTTVEGGMLCTDDEELYHLFLLKRSHGLARELPKVLHESYRKKYPEIDFEFLFLTDGYNFRNTEFNAVLGLAQIKKLDNYIQIRNDNYKKFLDICKRYKEELLLTDNPGISSFSLPFILKNSYRKKEFQKKLTEEGIQTRPIISGNLLKQPFLEKYQKDLPNAEYLHHNAFYIGNNQFVKGERLGKLEKVMEDFFGDKMHKSSRIYISGHNGLLGTALKNLLQKEGYENLLTRTHEELDLRNQNKVEEFFQKEKPEFVFLTAAKVGGIQANITYPAEFIYDNIQIQNNVINAAWKYGVKKLLFLGSACIYPTESPQPIKEEYLMTGKFEPTNEPYAIAKTAGIGMCQAYNRQYGTKFIVAIPANLFGPNDNFDKQNSHLVSALIRKFHEAKMKGEEEVILWGSGRPKREILFSEDLAEACVFLMNNYNSSEVINVGNGEDYPVREIAEVVKEIVGFEGRIVFDSTKPDGMMQRKFDITRMENLGWGPKTSLKEGIRRTYDWLQNNLERLN